MSDVPVHKEERKPRLKFIDMARSLAILMMLEGHFTGAALDWSYRDPELPLFHIWHIIHGLTSPLFFTVTGLIFAYLLTADNKISFWKNPRIKKGRKRVFQLLFWGYIIQLNLYVFFKSVYYGGAFYFDWFYAFHVLQAIAFGLAILIIVYGIYKWLNWGALHWYYLITGIAMFTVYAYLKTYIRADEELLKASVDAVPHYFPSGAPKFIQNMFYGQYSSFSFVRWSGYTIFGGAIGCFVRAYEHRVKEFRFGLTFIIVGLLVSLFAKDGTMLWDDFTEWLGLFDKGYAHMMATSLSRFGQVIVLLGILILIDKFVNVKAKLFLKIGQRTFPIYVVHVMILYGGLFGFGLKPDVFDRNLDPWSAVAISTFAMFCFIMMVKYIEPLERAYNRVLRALRLKKKDS
ncbi:MAG: heparan-alpha-glucosaminide N-acetyltransferase domain-containing protein [Crocinitomicaceae bacterium]|nr:heparan-alpha-glucosaminide N-acetyltransferase domain-containing protein [Crocinitomicaceae bacterium]